MITKAKIARQSQLSPGYRILRDLRSRRCLRLANTADAGVAPETGLPDVFQSDLSKMHPTDLTFHAKSLTPDQRQVVLRKLNSDVAATRTKASPSPAAPIRPAYGPESEEAEDLDVARRASDSGNQWQERQQLESLFSHHFNAAIGKATTTQGREAIVGNRPPKRFISMLGAMIPDVYNQVAAERGSHVPYDQQKHHQNIMAIGEKMLSPVGRGAKLRNYDPNSTNWHTNKTYGGYFGMVARKIAREHFENQHAG